MRKISILLYVLFLFPLVSSNGLQVLSVENNAVKIIGEEAFIRFSIQNQEAVSLYNVSLENNNYLEMTPIPFMSSGSIFNVSARIKTNDNFNATIRVKGFYNATVGQPNKIYNVNVTQFQSAPCSFSITKGDTINWRSNILSDIVMVNPSTNLPYDGVIIHNNETYTRTFPSAQTFRYYFSVSGFPFPETCTITVLEDSGLVNDPALDAFLSANATVAFKPTSIQVDVPIREYTIDWNEADAGVVTIKNVGNSTAKGVLLSGEWFTFSKNNFDLEVNKTEVITYSLKPTISITNQTNVHYAKTITIKGNFPDYTSNVNVFVPFAAINENSSFFDGDNIVDLICASRPDLCDNSTKIIYVDSNNSNYEFNVTVTGEQWKNLQLGYLEMREILTTNSNAEKERTANDGIFKNDTNTKLANISTKLDTIDEKQEKSTNSVYSIMTIGGGVLMAAMLATLIYINKEKILGDKLSRWQT